jgi:hypothetical protein
VRTAVLVIDDVPPSLNTVATSHWRKYGRIKKAWQGYCEGALMAEAVPRRQGEGDPDLPPGPPP